MADYLEISNIGGESPYSAIAERPEGPRSASLYWISLRETPARIGRPRAGDRYQGHGMRILRYFARADPWECLIVLTCLVLPALTGVA